MKILLVICMTFTTQVFAKMKQLPFCGMSISNAPGEEDAIQNVRTITFQEDLSFKLDSDTYKANEKFFRSIQRSCLGLQRIKVTHLKESFLVYNTIKDECDGGNTFGIIVSERTALPIATIDDGLINCN